MSTTCALIFNPAPGKGEREPGFTSFTGNDSAPCAARPRHA
jgi:hypothetical protein